MSLMFLYRGNCVKLIPKWSPNWENLATIHRRSCTKKVSLTDFRVEKERNSTAQELEEAQMALQQDQVEKDESSHSFDDS